MVHYGVTLYGQREIAYNQNDPKKRTKAFWEIIGIRTVTLLISSAIYIVFITVVGEYQTYYKILILEMIGAFFEISWFFKGVEDFKKNVIRNLIVRILSITAIFIFVKTKEDLIKYFIIYSIGNMVGNISLWFYLPSYLSKIEKKDIHIFRHFIPIIILFLPQISNEISNVLDKTLLGYLIKDKSEVGYYEQAQKLLRILITFTTSLRSSYDAKNCQCI